MGAIVPALAFADAARRPERAWEETGESRTRWLAEIALAPVVGSWLLHDLRQAPPGSRRKSLGPRRGLTGLAGQMKRLMSASAAMSMNDAAPMGG